jgi:hypothetical protein
LKVAPHNKNNFVQSMKSYSYILGIVFLLFGTSTSAQQGIVIKPQRKGVELVDAKKQAIEKQKIKYSLIQFIGKWQEVKRVQGNVALAFTDTLFIAINNEDNAYTNQGKQAKMVGSAAVSQQGNALLVAADIFTITAAADSSIVLSDDNGVQHYLDKKQIFWSETLVKSTVKLEEYSSPINPNVSALQGKWSVYRKKSKPGLITAQDLIIRQLTVFESADSSKASGEVNFYQADKSYQLPCIISVTNNELVIATEKDKWTIQLFKNQGDEIVFGNIETLLYYAKKIK